MKRIICPLLFLAVLMFSVPTMAQLGSPVDLRDVNLPDGSYIPVYSEDEDDKLASILTALGDLATSTKQDTLNTTLGTLATQSTLSTLNAKFVSGTDIGDVTINNAAGSAAYVQPGTGAQFTTVPATADAAEGSAPTNPPVVIGAKADSTEPAAVDDGDSAIPLTDLVKRLVTKGFCTPGNEVWDYVNITTDTETEVLAGAGASNYMYITFLSVISTGTTETEVIFYDDDACDGGGTAIFGAHVSDDPPSGVVIGNGDQPVLKVPTANQKFCVKAITTGADIHISTKGCKSTQ